MDPADICPNCGKSLLLREDHKCPSCELAINEDSDSTPFLDKITMVSESYEEPIFQLATIKDVTEPDIEDLQENILGQIEDEYESTDSNLLKRNPLISEGNPVTPSNVENIVEENEEDAFDKTSTGSGENFEKDPEFLETDSSLHAGESSTGVSQHGNPLDELPFQPLLMDDKSDSSQSGNKSINPSDGGKGQWASGDAVTEKKAHDLELNQQNTSASTSKFEPQNTPEGKSDSLPSGSEAGTSKLDSINKGCDLSEKEGLSTQNHEKHKISPSNKKPFVCGVCGKDFNQKRLLTGHLLIHSEVRRYECRVCKKTFYRSCDLRRHERIHSGEKPYVCDTCSSAFNNRSNYNRHRRRHNTT